ncbi:histidine phosphatase family protein [Dongia sp. agr-C8]
MPSRNTIRRSALLALAVGVAAMTPYAVSEAQEALIEQAMTKGGYVIYLRHASRLSGPRELFGADSPLAAFADCGQQRNLTAAGRGEAKHIGQAFQSFGVPIGDVYALPLCRTRETAQLAFGHALLRAKLYDLAFVSRMLAAPPAAGTNTVLVDTEDQVRRVAGVELSPGEAAIFQPDGKGGFRYDGKLDQEDLIR